MSDARTSVAAVVAAGDRGAAKAVYGQSKVHLELAGLALVAHVVRTLQDVPEVSEVWVVGDPERLAAALDRPELKATLRKPLHVVAQWRNLYENAWESYRCVLSASGAEGRDPRDDADRDVRVLYLSADVPFATPGEISLFVQRGLALDVDYAVGLVTETSMAEFLPTAPGAPGIHMACFNLREGRFRQSNLHLVRPGRLGNRHYVEELYEHRYQRQIGSIIGLAWRLLRSESGGLAIVSYYALMHVASIFDRNGLRRVADWIRRFVPISRVEHALARLLRASLRFVVTEIGGAAIDIDNEADYDAARARFEVWREAQRVRASAVLEATAAALPAAAPALERGGGP